GGGAGRVEVDFKLPFGPKDDFVDRVVALDAADLSVAALAAREKQLALFAVVANPEAARLLPHFERLQQVGHAHLLEAALDDTRTRRRLLQFFEVQPVHDFFGGADQILQHKWLGYEILDTVGQVAQLFFNVGTAGHEQERNVTGLFAPPQLLKELPAVQAGHL